MVKLRNTKVAAPFALMLLICLMTFVAGCDKRSNPADPEISASGRIFQGQHQYDGLAPGKQAPDWEDFQSRWVKVYAPPGYQPNTVGIRFPTLYLLPGYDGEPAFDYKFGNENYYPISAIRAIADRLINEGVIKPMFIVMPDASTFYGGTLFANSDLLGNWEDMMAQELVAYIDSSDPTKVGSGFRTLAQKQSRAIGGHMSGGYGAVRIAMKHPDLFNSVSAIDAPLSLGNDNMTPIFNMYIDEQNIASQEDFLDVDTLNIRNEPYKMLLFTMAGTFTPADDVSEPPSAAEPFVKMRINLPFDYQGTIQPDVWNTWLANDLYSWLDNASYQSALQNQNLYFVYSDHNLFGFHEQTEEFLTKLSALGVDYEADSYSAYEGSDPRSRTFLYDQIEALLRFHDQYLMDRDGNF